MDVNHLLTPKEAKKKFPEMPWTEQEIGWAVRLGLLGGIKYSGGSLVDPRSIPDAIEFTRSNRG